MIKELIEAQGYKQFKEILAWRTSVRRMKLSGRDEYGTDIAFYSGEARVNDRLVTPHSVYEYKNLWFKTDIQGKDINIEYYKKGELQFNIIKSETMSMNMFNKFANQEKQSFDTDDIFKTFEKNHPKDGDVWYVYVKDIGELLNIEARTDGLRVEAVGFDGKTIKRGFSGIMEFGSDVSLMKNTDTRLEMVRKAVKVKKNFFSLSQMRTFEIK